MKVALLVNLKEWICRSRVDTKEILEKKSLEKMEMGVGFMCAVCGCVVEGQVIRRSSPVEGKCNLKVVVVVAHLVPWTVAKPGSSVHGIIQARILEWVAMPFSASSF